VSFPFLNLDARARAVLHRNTHSLSGFLSFITKYTVLELETPASDTQNTKYCAVKVEIRDPVNKDAPRQKRKTEMKEVFDHRINFSDAFEFFIDEDKNEELRILLFKQKTSSFIGGKKAVANAAFHVKQIVLNCEMLDGEIDKSFNLFNREGNAVGGQVRLILTYFPKKNAPERTGKDGKGAIPDYNDKEYSKEEEAAVKKIQTTFRKKQNEGKKNQSKGQGLGGKAKLLLGGLVSYGILAFVHNNQEEEKAKKDPKYKKKTLNEKLFDKKSGGDGSKNGKKK